MHKLVFLHNSGDLKQLQVIVGLADEDCDQTGYSPWIDQPHGRDGNVGSIGNHATVDPQVADAIKTAKAVLYFVGNAGAGNYQAKVEADLVYATIKARENSDNPLQFLPILLNNGVSSDLPDWARQFSIINHDRSIRYSPGIWESIKQRLQAPVEKSEAGAANEAASGENDELLRLKESLLEPPRLTVFVGPYSFEDTDEASVGPAAVTQDLLAEVGLSWNGMLPILPWPSEAAEWSMLVRSRSRIQQLLRKRLAPLGRKPSDLAHSLGQLASRWNERFGNRARQKEWHGLLLLTTRVDLALESTLARQWGVPFTRILPTLNSAGETADRRRMVQRWSPDRNWDPDPFSPETSPCEDVASDAMEQLASFPLEGAESVILVKLCGTLEVPASLVLTGYDFFEHARSFEMLPKIVNEIIGASSQLFLGRGFASPLLNRIRVNVLRTRHRHLPRLWVVPPEGENDAGSKDPLCQLELRLLAEREQDFLRALDATALHRSQEHIFVRRLAEVL